MSTAVKSEDMEGSNMDVFCLKTMCLSTSKVELPSKEEHTSLLFNGLGARRWQIGMGCDSLSFKQAILNIYPRLRTVIGYNLWFINKSKQFERLPERANTPRRIKGFLGPDLPDCLMIVPISDITVMEENLEKLEKRNSEVFVSNKPHPYSRKVRGECLVCGNTDKMYGSLQKILTVAQGSSVSISENICKLLGVDAHALKRRDIDQQEICRKCLRNVKDMMDLESKLKKTKESFIGTFYQTVSKFQTPPPTGIEPDPSRSHSLPDSLSQAPQDVPLDFSKPTASEPVNTPDPSPPNFDHPIFVPAFPVPVKAEYPYFDPLAHLRGVPRFPGIYSEALQDLPTQLNSSVGGYGFASRFPKVENTDNALAEDLSFERYSSDLHRWGRSHLVMPDPISAIGHPGSPAGEEKLDPAQSRGQVSHAGSESTGGETASFGPCWTLPEGERLNSHGSGSPCSGNESTSSSSSSIREDDDEKEKRKPMKKRKRAQEN